MDDVGFIAWIVIGGLAGWIASMIMGTNERQGCILNVIVGVVGGLLGGFLLRLFNVDTSGFGWVLTLLTAILGACVLLLIVGMLTGRRRR